LEAAAGAAAAQADADAAASDEPTATQPYSSVRFALPSALWDAAPSSAAAADADKDEAAVVWAREAHTLTLVARDDAQGVALSAPLVLLDSAPLLRCETAADSSWKQCVLRQGGQLLSGDSDVCVVWAALDTLCVAVSRDEDDAPNAAWRLDARYGAGAGCEPWGSGEAPAATFAAVPAPDAEGDGIADAAAAAVVPTWGALRAVAPGRVQLRSAHDPALWAANATRGTMVFAQQAAERDAMGRVLLILGGLAMLTGAILGAPAMLAAARRHGAGVAIRKT